MSDLNQLNHDPTYSVAHPREKTSNVFLLTNLSLSTITVSPSPASGYCLVSVHCPSLCVANAAKSNPSPCSTMVRLTGMDITSSADELLGTSPVKPEPMPHTLQGTLSMTHNCQLSTLSLPKPRCSTRCFTTHHHHTVPALYM